MNLRAIVAFIRNSANWPVGALPVETKRRPKRRGFVYADCVTTVNMTKRRTDIVTSEVRYYGSIEAMLEEWVISMKELAGIVRGIS